MNPKHILLGILLLLTLSLTSSMVYAKKSSIGIDSCQTLHGEGLVYHLTQNVVSSNNNGCFIIADSNIVLDLNQFEIIGNEDFPYFNRGSGVLLDGVNSAIVQNGVIRNFKKDVEFSNSNYTILRDLYVNGAGWDEVEFFIGKNSQNNKISNSYISGYRYIEGDGESKIDGNYWATPEGRGFSQICTDDNSDDRCDTVYDLGNFVDNSPLSVPTVKRNPSSYGLDVDSDGKFDFLVNNFEIDVSDSGEYLIKTNGEGYSKEYFLYLVEGRHEIEMKVPGQVFSYSKNNGPYDFEVTLNRSGEEVSSVKYTTPEYNYSEFEDVNLSLGGIFDEDGNGLYDSIEVNMNFDWSSMGGLQNNVFITLQDDNGISSIRTPERLYDGENSIGVSYSGMDLYDSGFQNNLSLGNLLIEGDGYIINLKGNHILNIEDYSWEDFEKPSSILHVTDNVIDTNSDGFKDLLLVDVLVNISKSGNYRVSGQLAGNESFYMVSKDYFLDKGENTLQLAYSGSAISENGYNGFYKLEDLNLDYIDVPHTTAGGDVLLRDYSAPDFINMDFRDFTMDIDSDGYYESVVIEFDFYSPIEGNFRFSGNLEGINSDVESTNVVVGNNTIRMKFNGGDIFNLSSNKALVLNTLTGKSDKSSFNISGDLYTTKVYRSDDFVHELNSEEIGLDVNFVLKNEIVKSGNPLIFLVNVTNAGENYGVFKVGASNYNPLGEPTILENDILRLESGETKMVSYTFAVGDEAVGLNEFNFEFYSGGIPILQKPVSLEVGPANLEMNITSPGQSVIGDFVVVSLETNSNAVCEFRVDSADYKNLTTTGGIVHNSFIEGGLSVGRHSLDLRCNDNFENSVESSIEFWIDFSEFGEMLIQENIDSYDYLYSLIINGTNEDTFSLDYHATYMDESNFRSIVDVYEFEDTDSALNYLNELLGNGFVTLGIGDNEVYVLNGDNRNPVIWIHDNLIVRIMSIEILVDGNEGSSESPIQYDLISAYLDKYPVSTPKRLSSRFSENFSDVGIDTNENGAFDILRVITSIDVSEAGNYSVEGSLLDNEGNEIGENVSISPTLELGVFDVPIDFLGDYIFAHKVDGPYLVRFSLKDDNGTLLDTAEYNTRAYLSNEFGLEGESIISLRNLIVNPREVICGNNVTLDFEVTNEGSSIEDKVRFRIYGEGLGVDTIIEETNLEMGTFGYSENLNIPEGISEKSYILKVAADYDFINNLPTKTFLKTIPLNVICHESPFVEIKSTTTNARVNKEFTAKVVVTNVMEDSSIFSVNVLNYGSWASLVSGGEDVEIAPGENKTVEFVFSSLEGSEGLRTFDVEVASGDISKTEKVDVEVEPKEFNEIVLTKIRDATRNNPGELKVENTGDFELNIELLSEEGFELNLSENNFVLPAGGTKLIEIDAKLIRGLDFGDNEVNITARDIDKEVSSSILFNIESSFCSYGKIGNLKINDVRFNNKDGKDETWLPLENIEVSVNVENKGNLDVEDVVAEMGLFDSTGHNVVHDLNFINTNEEKIDLGNLGNSEDEDAVFSFVVPVDIEKGKYRLSIKAYGDKGGEDNSCVDSSKDLDSDFFQKIEIDKESNEDKFVTFNNVEFNSEVSCGENVYLKTDVVNTGDDDLGRIRVNLDNEDFNLNFFQTINNFNEGDESQASFDFLIPEHTKNGLYNFVISSDYDYKNGEYRENSDFTYVVPIRVSGCFDSSRLTSSGKNTNVREIIRLGNNSIAPRKIEGFFTRLLNEIATWFN